MHALLAVMRERGVTAVTMEVSSHALALGRVDGVRFDVAGFTNLTQDHLDFHGDMEDYFDAKAALFTPDARAIGGRLRRRRRGAADSAREPRHPRDDVVAARIRDADVAIAVAVPAARHARRRARTARTQRCDVPLPGDFNVANALGALALLVAAGVEPADAADGIAACERARPHGGGPTPSARSSAFVDYAHTPDAVERVLVAARDDRARAGVIAVLGAGGDRDRDKRPLMGQAAARARDVIVITDDNPRSEDPAAIRAAVRRGAASAAPARRARSTRWRTARSHHGGRGAGRGG